MVCALIGWMRRLRKQCNTSEPVPVFAKKTTPAPMSASARPPLTPEFQCCQRPPLACARLRKKRPFLFLALPLLGSTLKFGGSGGGIGCASESAGGSFFRKHRTRHIVFVRFVPTNFGARPGFPGIYSADKRAAKPG